ncbi:hypothetical protein AGR1A_Cc20116 [Agrobacterium fabacearum CFBP 5771]|nr:hypothetical protein AGR1A_Cc20116 [Agrobacterium fabacearum CFBP 5771]
MIEWHNTGDLVWLSLAPISVVVGNTPDTLNFNAWESCPQLIMRGFRVELSKPLLIEWTPRSSRRGQSKLSASRSYGAFGSGV